MSRNIDLRSSHAESAQGNQLFLLHSVNTSRSFQLKPPLLMSCFISIWHQEGIKRLLP